MYFSCVRFAYEQLNLSKQLLGSNNTLKSLDEHKINANL